MAEDQALGRDDFLRHHLCIHVTLGFFRVTGIPFRRPPPHLRKYILCPQTTSHFHLVCHFGSFLWFPARRPGLERSRLLALDDEVRFHSIVNNRDGHP